MDWFGISTAETSEVGFVLSPAFWMCCGVKHLIVIEACELFARNFVTKDGIHIYINGTKRFKKRFNSQFWAWRN
jgi:hypothetical protein